MADVKTKYLIVLAVVIFIILAGGIYLVVQNQNSKILKVPAKTQIPAVLPKTSPASKTTAPAKAPVAMSYQQALKTYAGRQIQFSVNASGYCTMTPYNASFMKGTTIMMDNRYSQQIKIFLNGVAYYISGYSFKIITLSSTPKTIKVDCQSGKNNGSILVR